MCINYEYMNISYSPVTGMTKNLSTTECLHIPQVPATSRFILLMVKKSCTTKDDDHPIIYRVLTIPGGAGFRPSTVAAGFFHVFHKLTKPKDPKKKFYEPFFLLNLHIPQSLKVIHWPSMYIRNIYIYFFKNISIWSPVYRLQKITSNIPESTRSPFIGLFIASHHRAVTSAPWDQQTWWPLASEKLS